MKVVYTFKCFW